MPKSPRKPEFDPVAFAANLGQALRVELDSVRSDVTKALSESEARSAAQGIQLSALNNSALVERMTRLEGRADSLVHGIQYNIASALMTDALRRDSTLADNLCDCFAGYLQQDLGLSEDRADAVAASLLNNVFGAQLEP